MEANASTQPSLSGLVHQLKTLEQVRRDELVALDEINRRQLAHANGDSIDAMDEYRRAITLAQQEQKAARRALETVAQLLAKQSKDNSGSDGEPMDASSSAELRAKRRRLESKSGGSSAAAMMRRESRSRESRSREPKGRDRDRDARDRESRDSRDRSERDRSDRDRGDRDSRDYYDRDRSDRDRDRDRSRGHRDRLREKEKERDRLQQRRRRDNTSVGSSTGGGGNGTERGGSSLSRGRSSGLAEAEIGVGCLVAARVSAATSDQAELWILATVLSYNSEKNRYTVQDEDDESPDRPTYVLPPRLVIFVSAEPSAATPAARRRRWDRSRNPEMPRGQRVLAMYPGTTSFYTGQVATPPSLNTSSSPVLGVASLADPAEPPPDPTSNPMYRVQFDDDDERERNVPAHLVVPQPRSSSSSSSSHS
ncbi:hypothetical protein IWW37_001349 [Coemansia sp. RSA 2050]|nr:hypothetical protein IWW37_001349 [Coemansia sp. RSA 2050]KAJ2735834.1 hypothetical protein IW152_001306 [Coemansia sp. BCRC 34962]